MALNEFLPDKKFEELINNHPDFKVYQSKNWASWKYAKVPMSVCVSRPVFLLRWMIYTNCDIDSYNAMAKDLGIYV